MQKEAKQRGEKLPGLERSTKRGNQQFDQVSNTEAVRDDDSGCFAMGRARWMCHDAERCWKKEII